MQESTFILDQESRGHARQTQPSISMTFHIPISCCCRIITPTISIKKSKHRYDEIYPSSQHPMPIHI